MSIWLQKSASIQPRTSPNKFAMRLRLTSSDLESFPVLAAESIKLLAGSSEGCSSPHVSARGMRFVPEFLLPDYPYKGKPLSDTAQRIVLALPYYFRFMQCPKFCKRLSFSKSYSTPRWTSFWHTLWCKCILQEFRIENVIHIANMLSIVFYFSTQVCLE